MSDSTPKQDPLENGMDDGTGDPDQDRAYLMNQPPAQVDDEEDPSTGSGTHS